MKKNTTNDQYLQFSRQISNALICGWFVTRLEFLFETNTQLEELMVTTIIIIILQLIITAHNNSSLYALYASHDASALIWIYMYNPSVCVRCELIPFYTHKNTYTSLPRIFGEYCVVHILQNSTTCIYQFKAAGLTLTVASNSPLCEPGSSNEVSTPTAAVSNLILPKLSSNTSEKTPPYILFQQNLMCMAS